ncbi:RNA helicase [Desulfofundulus sp. TPOSR]|uniref:helicase-related protein n=1 Tax=Desulfofundulus sp. TPOSR TaxID=2714340 RepID=UPI00140B93BD|nr:helicase-related protein [Desulfofundulus sp. TPOSR]NHM27395.1 RNA helicase [Desulfofundulus sp. TPOSR]
MPLAAIFSSPTCVEVIEAIQDHLPALYFAFSRGRTELLAEELGREWDFLTSGEKRAVRRMIQEAEENNPGLFGPRRQNLRRLLLQGIGYHHAGLSPLLKDLVERLYESRLVYVLFCTETFAVGVNFPAASTVFDACRKWDGQEFRPLLNREFFQMAGRAGRRGYDEVGRVFVRIDERFPEQTGFYREDEVEPVRGRLTISPNTVLSLLHWKTDAEIRRLLEKNLSVYQSNKESRQLRREVQKLEEKAAELARCFCPDRGRDCCELYRVKLRKELNQLKKSKHRNRSDIRQRRQEVQLLLQKARKKCRYKICLDASREIRRLEERVHLLHKRLKQLDKHSRDYVREFENVWSLLEKLGYVQGRELLPRGRFALYVHVQEILVTELVFSGIILESPPVEAAAILAGVDYQPGRDEQVIPPPFSLERVEELRRFLLGSGVPEHFCVWSPLPAALAAAWYQGATFDQLLGMTNLQEGDIFSILRREIDLLRQIERAAGEDRALALLARELRRRLDRDEVAVVGV